MYTPGIQHQAWLSLGSNIGDREASLEKACELIGERLGEIVIRSGLYESEAWGFESQNAFLNCCLELHTHLEPEALMEGLLQIEVDLGRKRSSVAERTLSAEDRTVSAEGGYTDRVIDLDLLFYGQLQIKKPDLELPHARLAERLFVLKPLAEIAPTLKHPVSGLSITELMDKCSDNSRIRRL